MFKILFLFFVLSSPLFGLDVTCTYAYTDGIIVLKIQNNSSSSFVICDLPNSIRNSQIQRGQKIIATIMRVPPTPETVGDWISISGISPEGERTALTRVRKIYTMSDFFHEVPKLQPRDKIHVTLKIRSSKATANGILLGPVKDIQVEFQR